MWELKNYLIKTEVSPLQNINGCNIDQISLWLQCLEAISAGLILPPI